MATDCEKGDQPSLQKPKHGIKHRDLEDINDWSETVLHDADCVNHIEKQVARGMARCLSRLYVSQPGHEWVKHMLSRYAEITIVELGSPDGPLSRKQGEYLKMQY